MRGKFVLFVRGLYISFYIPVNILCCLVYDIFSKLSTLLIPI